MSQYDPYERRGGERSSRTYYEERRDHRDSYLSPSQDLVPRRREDSELSVEEIRREFPPPSGYGREIRRARSAEPGYYDDYDDRRSQYGSYRERDREVGRPRSKKAGSVYYEEEEKTSKRVLSKQEKIIAAVVGGAIAIGGKELYDRREAKGEHHDVNRNPLTSAAIGAAGAFAAYQGAEFYDKKARTTERKSLQVHAGRDGVSGYYSEGEEETKEKKGHKNFLESALTAAGLGGAVKALTGKDHDDKKSDTRSRRGSRSRSPSKEKGGANKIQKAAMASLIAGATEAFRVSKEPGSWKGEKAKRIFTAAAGAATIDAAQKDDKNSKLGLAESVIGGLVGNRLVNGSKKNIEVDEKTGRSRSRSRARSKSGDGGGGGGGVSGLAALATAGLGAFGAKKIMDNRERSRSRRRSVDSRDSRDESPEKRRGARSRSRSVVDTARRSLAKIGIGKGPESDHEDESPRGGSRRHQSRRYSDDYSDDYSRDRGHGGGRGRDDYDDDRSYRGGGGRDRSRSRSRARGGRRGGSRAGSDTDLGDSDEDEKKAKKMRGKQILTTGLAAVATIHAAHNVYSSMEKRNARHKAVREGRLSEEEAQKLKSKALLQDAASVGIAALGIKGALSEMKEARETNHELKEWREEKAKRHERRIQRQNRSRSRSRSRSRADSWDSAAPRGGGRHDDGPHYMDGNPYGALPAPPVGYDDRR